MTDHRAEAEQLLTQAAREFLHPDGNPTHALAAAQVHATLADRQDSTRALLDTLLDRWQEVADAYKPADMGGEWDDTTRRYQHYRHTYQRTIRDLRHVLDTGRIPCGLMTDTERANGDCGIKHQDEERAS
jgi:hypothetical protein